MKYIFALFILASTLSAYSADRVIATLTVTNAAGTTNGQTLTVNGSVRTLTNSVFVPSTQILTNSTAAGSKTNILSQISLNPFAQVIAQNLSSTAFTLSGVSGLTLTVTPSAGWATVAYTTQSVASVVGVRVPITSEPSGGMQTNIASLLVSGIGALSTNAFNEVNIAVTNLVGITNAQTISGVKQFTNVSGIWYGYVSNSTGISGNVNYMTNGLYRSPVLNDATMTNGANYGDAFKSPGSGISSEQFGTSALATAQDAIAFGNTASASGIGSTAIGTESNSTGEDSISIGSSSSATATSATSIGVGASSSHANSSAFGRSATTTTTNQIRLGTAAEYASIPGGMVVDKAITNIITSGTNTFPAGSDIAFGRYALASLANGANSITVGTNTFVEVSGPTAAFSIAGISGSPNRDGKYLILVSQVGFNMTISHESGTEPTAANRIISLTGADQTSTTASSATLIYSGAASRWILISFSP